MGQSPVRLLLIIRLVSLLGGLFVRSTAQSSAQGSILPWIYPAVAGTGVVMLRKRVPAVRRSVSADAVRSAGTLSVKQAKTVQTVRPTAAFAGTDAVPFRKTASVVRRIAGHPAETVSAVPVKTAQTARQIVIPAAMVAVPLRKLRSVVRQIVSAAGTAPAAPGRLARTARQTVIPAGTDVVLPLKIP